MINACKILIIFTIITFVWIAIIGRDNALEVVFGPIVIKPIDFKQHILVLKPNQFLVCPPDYCADKPHMISPVFAVSNRVLQHRWNALMATQPEIESGAAEDRVMQYDYIQRSSLMRFPDSITVKIISLGKDQSTLAIYSRSHYGYRDFGVNEARIRKWLDHLIRN